FPIGNGVDEIMRVGYEVPLGAPNFKTKGSHAARSLANLARIAGSMERGVPGLGAALAQVGVLRNDAYYFANDNATALHIRLGEPLPPGEATTVELNFHLKLPAKKGRWGQWNGITTLAQWLPVVAVHDANGWQPTPFI